VGPRGAGGATQEGAGRAGGERHGGFLCLVGGRSRRRGEGRRNGTGEDRAGAGDLVVREALSGRRARRCCEGGAGSSEGERCGE